MKMKGVLRTLTNLKPCTASFVSTAQSPRIKHYYNHTNTHGGNPILSQLLKVFQTRTKQEDIPIPATFQDPF
ncbi:hypothetical protein UPYG_G00109900 [Umbra pygmaea]|uniref:Uncharacterized protein n=1 Tax=Umbra pygmaea TaxID=75934 RepID=A0ABD0X2S9_UMBPY